MTVTCRQIAECVAKSTGTTVRDILYHGRRGDAAPARRITYLLARELTPYTLQMIGRQMGGRDHTTVVDGLRQITAEALAKPELAARIEEIRQEVIAASAPAEGLAALDPLDIAHRVDVSKVEPSLAPDEIRCLAEELIRLAGLVDQFLSESSDSADLVEPLRNRQRLSAASSVAKAYQTLLIRKSTPAEPAARRALEDALKTLSPLFQKDMNA